MKIKVIFLAVLTMIVFTACKDSIDSVEGFKQNAGSKLEASQSVEDESLTNDLASEQGAQSVEDPTLEDVTITQNEVTIFDFEPTKELDDTQDIQVTTIPQPTQGAQVTAVPQPTQETQVTAIPQPDQETQVTTVPQPTQSVQVTKTPQPTKAPQVSQQPTKAPQVTVQPTNSPQVTQAPKATATPVPTKVPTIAPTNVLQPTNEPIPEEANALSVRNQTITMGESKSSILSKFGSPARIDATEFNYDYLVYSDNYSKFMMIAVADDQVVGWYTDATDFEFGGLTTVSKVEAINRTYDKSLSIKRTLLVTQEEVSITFYMDTLGDSTIDGILVVKDGVINDGVSDSVLTAWEKEVFDLTNSFRARNGLSALAWSSEAAKVARLHSQDMEENDYFDHIGLNGSNPGDRLTAQAISYQSYGENIIAGYGNALYSSNGWMNSSGHRTNLLNDTFTYLGVGYVLGGSYGNYATQNFFSK